MCFAEEEIRLNRFLASSLLLIIAPVVLAQTNPPASSAAAPVAQSGQQKFVIADVHVSTTARGFVQNFGGVLREGLYVNRDATMLNLIESAYGVSEDTIAGGAGWVGSDLFDVVAKVPEGTTKAAANIMLQN